MSVVLNSQKESLDISKEQSVGLFVPGRLCLFGEHSDWAGRFTETNSDIVPGRAIVTGIDLGIYATAKKDKKFKISSFDENGSPAYFECEMERSVLKHFALCDGYFSYACGVAAYLSEICKIGGIYIKVEKITLPIKKGLSSSAAICVLVARAFNELYRLMFSTNGEMNVAYRGEMETRSRCGRLDQACAYGMRPVLMNFDGDRIEVEKLKVGKDLFLVFADLMSHKDTKKILTELNKCYPFPQSERDRNVHSALGAENCRIIDKASAAISAGDAKAVGAVMKEAQELFDKKIAPACPGELSAPKLHEVLRDKTVMDLSYGGKGVGSQGDGSVQFVAKDKKTQKELVNYLKNEYGYDAYPFTIPSRERIKTAIIPVAGYGTRMYPATRFIKKSFMPVVDENDIAKPVICCLLEELDKAKIEKIILIVGEDEVEDFKGIFHNELTPEHIAKLPEKVRNYEKWLSEIVKKISFVVQKERRGFGHAVYQARKYVGSEPCVLMLGDFIYKSNLSTNCVSQTMNAYIKSGGQLTVSIKPVALDDVVHYGILSGEFYNDRQYLMHVNHMIEKPSIDYARDYLGTNCSGEVKYFATFGQYVLTPDVFNHLEKEIAFADKLGSDKEISLTEALSAVGKEKGMTGVLVDGESYDVGIPKAYRDTVARFGK